MSRSVLSLFLLVLTCGCESGSIGSGNAGLIHDLESKGVKVARDLKGKVKTIRFGDYHPTDTDLEEIQSLTILKQVHATAPEVSDSGLSTLGKLSQLEALSVTGSKITGTGLAAVVAIPSLKELDLSGSANLDEAQLESLRGNAHIEKLDLSQTPLTDGAMTIITSLPNLMSLRIIGTKVTDAGIEQLVQGGQNLTELAIGGESTTDASIPGIVKFADLRVLEFVNSPLTDDGLRVLQPLPKLELLRVHYNPQLTNAGILSLGELPRLTQLDVSGTQFTGLGFDASGFKTLKVLEANDTQLTDESIPHFRNLPTLFSLKALGTTVTEPGVRKVFASNHQTAVEFPTP